MDDKDGVTFNRFPSSSYSGMGMSVLKFPSLRNLSITMGSKNLVPV